MKQTTTLIALLVLLITSCAVTEPLTSVVDVTRIVEVTQIAPVAETDEKQAAETPSPGESAPADETSSTGEDLSLGGESSIQESGPEVGGCAIFPADHIWNVRVNNLPVHPNSDAYVSAIGRDEYTHADFGSGEWEGEPIGIPFNLVPGDQPKVNVAFDYADESDPGPYPIPENVSIEGGPNSSGDRHILLIDQDNCVLYEIYDAYLYDDGSWHAGSGAIFDLGSYTLRPDEWTSADAAGLPIFPGLVLYDEIIAGEIKHALRFTASQTQQAYVWPARHYASDITDSDYPPMGQRFRLRADFDISGFSHEMQVILQALKTYGMILADNGAPWFISGAPDPRWNNDSLREFHQIPGSAFEAVDVSSLMVDPDSGQTRP